MQQHLQQEGHTYSSEYSVTAIGQDAFVHVTLFLSARLSYCVRDLVLLASCSAQARS